MTGQSSSFPPSEAQSGNPDAGEERAAGFPLTRFALAGMTRVCRGPNIEAMSTVNAE
jgi:hypothetical protein